MDESLDKKIDLKDKIKSFFEKNKLKLIIFLFFVLASFLLIFLFNENQKKKNILLSEKFVKARLLLSSGDKEKATEYYDEIILSKNKFYSLLALNTMLEKNLETDKEKILNYFAIIEKTDITENSLDLILFKKALYLMDNSEKKSGIEILKKLIEKNSNLKSIAEEIILE